MSSPGTKLALVGCVAVAIAAAVWLGWPEGARQPVAKPQEPVAAERETSEPVSVTRYAVPEEAPVAPPPPPESETMEAPGPPARVVGRCVDEKGKALAGVTVALRGGPTKRRSARWTWEQLPLRWSAPEPAVTAANGRFEFEFLAPPTHFFYLEADAPGRVGMRCYWDKIAAGAVVRLGDVPMRPGCRVTGRVADTNGLPQPGLTVRLDFKGHFPAVTHRGRLEAVSGPDGEFEFADPVPPGRWSLRVRSYPRIEPAEVEIPRRVEAKRVEVLVAAAADIRAVSGTVIDGGGAPVEKAEVRYLGAPYHGRWVRTAADGTFRLLKDPEDGDAPVQLLVTKPGHEVARAEAVPWGTTGMIVSLPRGAQVHVTAVRPGGEPFERYTAAIYSHGDRYASTWNVRNEAGGVHEKGRATLGPFPKGQYVLMVQPAEDGWADCPPRPFRIDGQDVHETFVVPQNHVRTMQLRSASGEPIEKAQVELLDAWDVPVTPQTRAFPLLRWMHTTARDKALLLQKVHTDAAGQADLAGPPRPLTIRVQTFEHGQRIVPGVRLDVGGPLIVTMQTTAGLTGVVGSAKALEALRQSDQPARFAPRVELRRVAPEPTVFPAASGQAAAIAQSGAYALDGAPPGAWDVHVTWFTVNGVRVREHTTVVAKVALSPGETRAMDLQLPAEEK